jgi:hypothetical protein
VLERVWLLQQPQGGVQLDALDVRPELSRRRLGRADWAIRVCAVSLHVSLFAPLLGGAVLLHGGGDVLLPRAQEAEQFVVCHRKGCVVRGHQFP